MGRGSLTAALRSRFELWRRDYAAMQETMFFGSSPAIDEILAAVEEFEAAINRSAGEGAEGASKV